MSQRLNHFGGRGCFPETPVFTETIRDDGKTYRVAIVQAVPTASEVIVSTTVMGAEGKAAAKATGFKFKLIFNMG